MAEIKVDDEKLQAAMQVAILEAIGPIGREAIIRHAVREITKTTDSYGQKEGPLWTIIRDEARKIAEAVIRGKLEKDAEFLAAIENVYAEGAKRVLADAGNREKLIERVTDALRKALTGDRY